MYRVWGRRQRRRGRRTEGENEQEWGDDGVQGGEWNGSGVASAVAPSVGYEARAKRPVPPVRCWAAC